MLPQLIVTRRSEDSSILSTVGWLLAEIGEITMNMKRVLEPVDLMVAAGIVAIVIGAFLVFVSAQGRFQIATADDVTNRDTSDPVQPALGQTLVAISLLEREGSGEITRAVKKLNQVTTTAQQIDRSTQDQVRELAEQADNQRVAKTARAEFVKGRSVVNSTTRTMRNGSPPDQQREVYDRRMIEVAAEAGRRIEHEFEQTRESNLGRAIVAETQRELEATHRNQEQVGAAIVQVSRVQEEYRGAYETAQEQLGLLVSAAGQAQL